MNYLVVSDNHGDRDVLVDLFDAYRGKVDQIFHCGDSELQSDDPIWEGVVKARGNCDYDSGYPEESITKTGEDVVYMTHGHLVNVKMSLTPISLKGQDAGANIVLFGHTHELGVELVENMLYLNPGSIRLPRGKYMDTPTYAVIETSPENYHIQYFDRAHQPVSELAFDFPRK